MLLGGGRAVLMQLAHPLVAAGVGEHSAYASDPWGRVTRTLMLMQRLTFGTRSDALAAARTINRLHHGVTGTLAEPAGELPSGTPYRAGDPALLLWVYATLVDTGLELYPLLVEPLTPAEQERYYQESKLTAALLGLHAQHIPERLDDFRAYMHAMLTGNTLALTQPAREVADTVMRMPAPIVLRPLLLATEQVTIGLLPPRVRELYGYSWDPRRQRLLELWAAGMRCMLPLVPPAVRALPWARAARRRVRRQSACCA
jgi:uncharacterized protein (DUF2236 family)